MLDKGSVKRNFQTDNVNLRTIKKEREREKNRANLYS